MNTFIKIALLTLLPVGYCMTASDQQRSFDEVMQKLINNGKYAHSKYSAKESEKSRDEDSISPTSWWKICFGSTLFTLNEFRKECGFHGAGLQRMRTKLKNIFTKSYKNRRNNLSKALN